MLAETPIIIPGAVLAGAVAVVGSLWRDLDKWEKENPASALKMREAVGWIIGGVIAIAAGVMVVLFVHDTQDSAVWKTVGVLGSIGGAISAWYGLAKKIRVTSGGAATPATPAPTASTMSAITLLLLVGKTVVGKPGTGVLGGTWQVSKADITEVVLTGTGGKVYRMSPAMFEAALADGTLTAT